MRKKTAILAAALVSALIISVAAASLDFIFNQTPYYPGEYSWTAPWEVKQKVEFVEATLTVTGSSYEGDSHNAELILKNVATEPDYVITDMAYSASWNVGAESEVIIGGTFSGALLVGEIVTYTGVFTPIIVGIGNVEMSVINIVWVESEPITWTKDTTITHSKASDLEILSFTITGATMSYTEPGTVAFKIKNKSSYENISLRYKVEIVEAGITVAEASDTVNSMNEKSYSFNFDPVPIGGSLTMLITIANP